MLKKKICMLGAFAVGKTSLVQRFVKNIFSDKYLTTIGVKIDKKTMAIAGQDIDFILWDIHGEDEFQKVRTSYLRGAAGCLLVIDMTRSATMNTAFVLQKRVEETIGEVPFVLVFNKSDLESEYETSNEDIEELSRNGMSVIRTSAKTGQGVEEAFLTLANLMLED